MQTSSYMIPDTATAFVALLRDHQRLVYRIARSYGRGRADIEDLAQEIAAQAWRAFSSYDSQRRFSTWLYRIGLNVAISWLRVEAPRRQRSVPYDAGLHERTVGDAAEDFEADDASRILDGFIESQGPLDRAVLLLYLEDRPMADISEILGLSTTNLSTKINRLKERLRVYANPGEKHGTR
jgi:RNA polymerase sigma factor (sigma-70 family)